MVQALCTEPQNMLNKPPKPCHYNCIPILQMRKRRHSGALIRPREGLWVSSRATNRPQLLPLANAQNHYIIPPQDPTKRYPQPVAAGAEGLEIAPKAMRETEAQECARSVRRKVGR
ncbi:hypothetical protein H8957_010028 [Semnopithecus entellus]